MFATVANANNHHGKGRHAVWCKAAPAPQRPPGYAERVDVARIIVDARVVDAAGSAVIGLGADDFTVTIDGKPARVESALWVGVGEPRAGEAPLASTRFDAGGVPS